jgi:hydrogenase small subunit
MLVAQRQSAGIHEFDILWITAGLGCDGDTIAMTAAAQPSLEDLLSGSLPWLPKIHLHNPFLSFDNGEEFMAHFHAAADGQYAREFILVVEGFIPNEKE